LCGESESFPCASGICVPRKLQCNGYNDCDDWSDEAHCIMVCVMALFVFRMCLYPQWWADTGFIIPFLRCTEHCILNSKRILLHCSEDLFHCHTGKCLNYSLVCDGYDDCGDLSDEQNCACRSQGLVECRNGQCIPSTFQCDGDEDCKDGSDEENCGDSQTPCQEGNQRCLYNSCLDSCGGSSLCDLNNSLNNCSKTQKEASISWESSLFPALVQTNCYKYLMFFACTILVPKCDMKTNQRIPPCRALCEHSKEHCESVLGIVGLQWPEDTDCNQFPEENSVNHTCLMPGEDVEECSPSHFKCGSGRCVLASRRCDGQADCDDDSDEENCGCEERDLWECPSDKQSFCRDDELECANHECVSRDRWCDGEADCLDSSDEWDCGKLLLTVVIHIYYFQFTKNFPQVTFLFEISILYVKTFGFKLLEPYNLTLSKNVNSSSFLTAHRSATERHVCADGWQETLSQLACKQMGLGSIRDGKQ
ncbi:hypothetical protein HPG69_001550, partial [Diceros bicornis minor]